MEHSAEKSDVLLLCELFTQFGHHKTVLEERFGWNMGVAAQFDTKQKIGRCRDAVIDGIHTHRFNSVMDRGKSLGLAAIGSNRDAMKGELENVWIGQGQPFKITVFAARHSSQQVQK